MFWKLIQTSRLPLFCCSSIIYQSLSAECSLRSPTASVKWWPKMGCRWPVLSHCVSFLGDGGGLKSYHPCLVIRIFFQWLGILIHSGGWHLIEISFCQWRLFEEWGSLVIWKNCMLGKGQLPNQITVIIIWRYYIYVIWYRWISIHVRYIYFLYFVYYVDIYLYTYI